MRKRFFIYPLLLAALSCDYDDKLNPVPSTLISDLTSFESASRVSNQVNGLYASFKASGFWGSQYLYYSEARAGNFVSTNLNPTRGGQSYQMIVDASTSDVSNVWTQGYQIINACNLFLTKLPVNGESLIGATLTNQYLAEARFLRGITYYYLLQLFAQPYIKDDGASPGLPLRLEANTGLKDYNLARSSVKEVYNQILEDLNFAEQNLPNSYGTALLNTTRAHKNTAIAMKSNVYLAMGKYAEVITESNKLVPTSAPYKAASGVGNQLENNIASVFAAPYTSNESIFSMPFAAADIPGTSLGNAYLPDGANAVGLGSSGTGDFYMLENGVVAESNWKATDARRNFVFRTPSGANTGRLWCTKYKMGTPFADYIPVVRYAQVMLNLAEALTKQNGVDARAISLLNAVRQRSDATTTFAPTSKADLEDLIYKERNIEFFGEGVRNIDIVRQLKPIPAKIPGGGSPVSQALPTDPNYLWPLPTSETLYNKSL